MCIDGFYSDLFLISLTVIKLHFSSISINLASVIRRASAHLLFRRHRSLIRKLSNVKRVRSSIEY